MSRLLLLTVLAGCAGAGVSGPRPAPGATAANIEAEDLRLRVGIIADDSMLGRDTGSPGIEKTAHYIADEMRRLGLRPAGDAGSYLQRVPMERRVTTPTISVTSDAGTRALGLDEVVPVSGLGGLPAASRSSGEGPLIFGGYLQDPEVGSDELEFDQLDNAVVILRLGAAPGVDPERTQPRMSIATLLSPASPAAAVLLVAGETEEAFWDFARETAEDGAVALAGQSAGSITAPPFFLISPEAAESLIGVALSGARKPLTDLGTFSYQLDERTAPIEAWNVAAILPGGDPKLAGEYVALGAHYDHVGVGAPVDGDSIYNGADDDASGTTTLLEVAEALASGERPSRSILFVWHTGEELGLLGSEYFTDHPTVTRDSIITQLNVDMVGRNDPDTLMLVGSRRLSSELGEIVEQVNQQESRPFNLDYSFDTPGHPEQLYCRSDHYNYARYGIPITFFTTGLHDDYHMPSDEPDLLDYGKMARVGNFLLDLTRTLADRPGKPAVDKPVPPLGTPCQA